MALSRPITTAMRHYFKYFTAL
uniref:Uncharacterized protein n=1 Tax=Anguilla anguilla TaxID=7936 RepID=A0A0E9VUI0_ANGAN